jgi:hypothetical protein
MEKETYGTFSFLGSGEPEKITQYLQMNFEGVEISIGKSEEIYFFDISNKETGNQASMVMTERSFNLFLVVLHTFLAAKGSEINKEYIIENYPKQAISYSYGGIRDIKDVISAQLENSVDNDYEKGLRAAWDAGQHLTWYGECGGPNEPEPKYSSFEEWKKMFLGKN